MADGRERRGGRDAQHACWTCCPCAPCACSSHTAELGRGRRESRRPKRHDVRTLVVESCACCRLALQAAAGWGHASVVVAGQSIDKAVRGGKTRAGDQAAAGRHRPLSTTTTTRRVCRHSCTAAARSPARSRAGREELELGLRAPPRRGVGRPENGPPVARPTAGVASGWTYATVLLPRYAN